LHIAAEYGMMEIVELLLDKGANPNEIDVILRECQRRILFF